MSEEQLKELQEYNLEYLEAQQSEEIFGGDYTSAVELKYAKKEIERLNNIINELEKYCKSEINSTPTFSFDRYYTPGFNDGVKSVLNKLKELKGSDKE